MYYYYLDISTVDSLRSATCLLVAGVDMLGGQGGGTLGGPRATWRVAHGARVRTTGV